MCISQPSVGTVSLQTKDVSCKQRLQGFQLVGAIPGVAFLPAETLISEVILVCSSGTSTAEREIIDWGNEISLSANF